MATPANPYVGSGWSPAPSSNSVLGSPLFNTGEQPPQTNALLSWTGSNINQPSQSSSGPPPSGPFTAPTFTAPSIVGGPGNPGGLPELPTNLKDAMRAAGYLNTLLGAERVQMAPQFANEMFALATPAANFFNTLMSDDNSPFYRAKQSEAFNQGVLQNQNAFANANQQLNTRGYGYAPSGVNAALLGAMNMQGAQSLSEQYLQNLFNNEQLRLQGAQGQSGLAAMFNPSPLFGNVDVTGTTQGPSLVSGLGEFLKGAAAVAPFFLCWIARAVYGTGSTSAAHIRQRFLKLSATKPVYSVLVAAYLAVGEKVAEKVKRVPALKEAFRSLFDQFLANENRWPIGTFFNLLCAEGGTARVV